MMARAPARAAGPDGACGHGWRPARRAGLSWHTRIPAQARRWGDRIVFAGHA